MSPNSHHSCSHPLQAPSWPWGTVCKRKLLSERHTCSSGCYLITTPAFHKLVWSLRISKAVLSFSCPPHRYQQPPRTHHTSTHSLTPSTTRVSGQHLPQPNSLSSPQAVHRLPTKAASLTLRQIPKGLACHNLTQSLNPFHSFFKLYALLYLLSTKAKNPLNTFKEGWSHQMGDLHSLSLPRTRIQTPLIRCLTPHPSEESTSFSQEDRLLSSRFD